MKKELLSGLNDEQIQKLANCHSAQEILELARQESYVLNDEQLECVSGGGCTPEFVIVACPQCGRMCTNNDVEMNHFRCDHCNIEWTRDDMK